MGTHRVWWRVLAATGCMLLWQSTVAGLEVPPYDNEEALAALLWERATAVLDARAAITQAQSEYLRALLYPNPSLEAAWNTIPVGRTNPPGLADRLDRVPSYSAALAQLFEIGKRAPRQAARLHELERSRAEALATLGDRFFSLLGLLGRIAADQQRIAVLEEQLRDGMELLELDRARATRGEIAPLDVDVAEVEQARLRALREAAEADLKQAQSDCTALLALPCPPFPTTESAHAFLVRGYSVGDQSDVSLDDALRGRPDIQALRAAIAAAEQRAALAQRRIVPDVTVRAGYTYDQFVRSGNQRNSLALGLEIPIPAFDRGQSDLMAARAEETRAREVLRVLTEGLPTALQVAREQLALARRRMEQLDQAVAKARGMRDALVEAQRAGGISAIEVLVARRNYGDLLRERTELDGEAFSAVLAIRKLLGVFPRVSKEERAP